MTDIWTTIAAERGALADDLTTLTPAQWDTPSLCSKWTVRDVLAHLSATASMSPGKFFVGMARSGFNFAKFSKGQLAQHRSTAAPTRPRRWPTSAVCSTAPPRRRVPRSPGWARLSSTAPISGARWAFHTPTHRKRSAR